MSRQSDINLDATSQPERLSGGRSARLAALVVGGVLVAVVWIGMSGRSAPIQPSPTAPALAVVPVTPPATSAATVEPAPPSTPRPVANAGDVFGVYAQFGSDQYTMILSETEPGHLVGRLSLPLPIAADEGTIVFEQFSSPSGGAGRVLIADWPIDVGPVITNSPRMLVLSASVPARRSKAGAPRPVISGFRLTVNAQRDLFYGELRVDVHIGPNRALVGNDGIFGWPTVANIAALRPPLPYSRERGVYNYCRWDLSPLSAPPRPGTDEAAC